MVNYEIDPKRFEILKELYIRSLKNYETNQISQLLSYYMRMLTCDRYWTYEELIENADEMTVEKLKQFVPQLLSKLHIESLFHGNVTQAEAMDVISMVENELKQKANTKPLPLSQQYKAREYEIPNGSSYLYQVVNKIHQTKGIEIYLQTGIQNINSNTKLELLHQLLHEPFFNILRTQEQLGYLTYASTRRNNGVQGKLIVKKIDL